MADTPDTSQGFSVGDAVLSFLAETTQLDEAFKRIPQQAQEAMDKAAESVSAVSDATDDVASGMTAAGESAGKAGQAIGEGMGKGSASVREAKGEVALLGELFGVHLPRHVRGFVAELPGVAPALSAAFGATAIIFLIEALGEGIEKLKEWAEHAHKVALAFEEFQTETNKAVEGIGDKLLEAGAKVDELTGNHLAALKKELELIDHQSLKELEQEFGLLAKAADAMFEQLKAHWYEFGSGSKGAQRALEDFKAQYDLLLSEGKKKDASDLLAGTLKAAKDTQKALADAKKEAEELQKASTEETGPAFYTGPSEKEIEAQDVLVRALQAQADAEQKINELTQDQSRIKIHEEGAKAAERDAQAAKANLDQQLTNIETWKAAQHTAYEMGTIDAAAWKTAELQATDAVAIAHESYQKKLVEIFTRAGETEKAHQAQLQLTALETKNAAEATDRLAESMNKHRDAVMRVREEYGKLVDAGLNKEFEKTEEAAKRLTAADEELQKAETKLAETKLADKYKDMETAIQKLAAMHLITEEQKDDRLKLLEQQQANEAVAILQKQLADEQKVLNDARSKLGQAQARIHSSAPPSSPICSVI